MELRPASYFVLAALLDGPLHGYAISSRAAELSGNEVRLTAGTLYGALDRMAARGLVEIDGEETVEGRLRRYYRLTDGGRDAVLEEADRLAAAARVVQVRRDPAETGEGARMTARARRRLNHTITGIATITFPKARRSDALVVRDCAREAVDATNMRALPRESLSLVMAGMRTRIGLAATEFRHAPWRDALAVLAPPAGGHAPAGLDLRLHLALRPLAARGGLGPAAGRLAGGGGRRRARASVGSRRPALSSSSPPRPRPTSASGPERTSPARRASTTAGASTSGWHRCSQRCCSWPPGSACARSPAPAASAIFARLAAGLAPALVAAVYLFPGPSREPTIVMDLHVARAEPPRLSPRGALSHALDPGIEAAAADPRDSHWQSRSS